MLVFVSQQRATDKHGQPCDCLESSYVDFFSANGITLLPVPNLGRVKTKAYLELFSQVEGLVLSGGNNICPEMYSRSGVDAEGCAPVRDETEQELLKHAVENRMPVLGICRGMQFINVYFGGSLTRDLFAECGQGHSGCRHDLFVSEERCAAYLSVQRWEMQSYHDQGVLAEALAPSLRSFVTGPQTRVVEGLYHPALPVAGIQFHPEREKQAAGHITRLVQAFSRRELFWSAHS